MIYIWLPTHWEQNSFDIYVLAGKLRWINRRDSLWLVGHVWRESRFRDGSVRNMTTSEYAVRLTVLYSEATRFLFLTVHQVHSAGVGSDTNRIDAAAHRGTAQLNNHCQSIEMPLLWACCALYVILTLSSTNNVKFTNFSNKNYGYFTQN